MSTAAEVAQELEKMSLDELRIHVAKTKEIYDKTRKYALQMDQKLTRSQTREKRIIVDHQKQVMQAETLNIMTKYQLVFAKIECQFNKVLNSNKIRELAIAQRAFDRFRDNARAKRVQENYRAHLIKLRLDANLGTAMLSRYASSRARAIRKLFDRWRLHASTASLLIRMKQALAAELAAKEETKEKLAAELSIKRGDLSKQETARREIAQRHAQLKRQIEEAEQQLLSQQQTARSKQSDGAAAATTDMAESGQQARLLQERQQQYEHLLGENKKLKATVSACEANLLNYVSEMNALVDQHEAGSIIGQALMPNDSDMIAIAQAARGSPAIAPNAELQEEEVPGPCVDEAALAGGGIHNGNSRTVQQNQMGETGGGP